MGSALDGRHALITGGGTGIGAAAARQLSGHGAKLSLLGRRLEPLQAVAESLGGTSIQCDVTDPGRVAQAFDKARAANGPIDLLIVNAGIAESAPFHKMSRESWDRIVATNLTAAFDCARAAIGDLLKSDGGRLVFVASVASLRGVPYAAHYAASKHGLLGLMRSLAAAITGCGQARIARTRSPVIRVKRIRPWLFIFVSGPMISWTSPPEQKLPPAPRRTTAFT
jgi:NAD(P)-dependent dehydrogenase (short-subunit alcohol dehydrogenase family)